MSPFIAFSCAPQYPQPWVPLPKLNVALCPPAARYCAWKFLLLSRVMVSNSCAGRSAPPNSVGVPLPQYTQRRVPLDASRPTLTVGSLRSQAGLPAGPHIGVGSNPPESRIAKPTSVGQMPADKLRKPDSEPA